MFITNAGQASWIVCFASTDRSKGHKGLSAFVIPMDAEGVTIEKHLDKMGQRATDTSAVAFQDVVVPEANRLGGEGDGFKIAMQTLDFTRPGTAVGAVGVAQAAYELAVDYAKERVQFGMPIAMNQGVSFLVADMATEIEAARLLTWQAAWMIDQGYGRKATKYSSFAKRFAADTAMKVTTDAVQVFGGYGYIKEYPVEKLMRDAKLFQIYEGTSQIQRLVIAKEIFLSGDVSPARLHRVPGWTPTERYVRLCLRVGSPHRRLRRRVRRAARVAARGRGRGARRPGAPPRRGGGSSWASSRAPASRTTGRGGCAGSSRRSSASRHACPVARSGWADEVERCFGVRPTGPRRAPSRRPTAGWTRRCPARAPFASDTSPGRSGTPSRGTRSSPRSRG